MLSVEGLSAWYGQAQVLRELDFRLEQGQVVTLVGRNGAGKTTALRCLTGLHAQMKGRVLLDGKDITALPPHQRARLGLGYVPDDRGIYATLSVEENLRLPPKVGPDAWSLDRIYEAFPRLKERRRNAGSKLSGRAADAGDGPRPGDGRPPAPARRADRGSGAGPGAAGRDDY